MAPIDQKFSLLDQLRIVQGDWWRSIFSLKGLILWNNQDCLVCQSRPCIIYPLLFLVLSSPMSDTLVVCFIFPSWSTLNTILITKTLKAWFQSYYYHYFKSSPLAYTASSSHSQLLRVSYTLLCALPSLYFSIMFYQCSCHSVLKSSVEVFSKHTLVFHYYKI